MTRGDDIDTYSSKESEREERRDKKRRPRMNISGRSVLGLAEIIARRAQNLGRNKRKK